MVGRIYIKLNWEKKVNKLNNKQKKIIANIKNLKFNKTKKLRKNIKKQKYLYIII